jgi:uncharacterized protein (DUF1501 family)
MRATRLTRRQFLAGAAGAGVAGATGVTLAHGSVGRTLGLTGSSHPGVAAAGSAKATPIPPGKGTLVLITMYGGNDGLNTVIPYADPAYLAGRPSLGWQPNQVLPLDGALGLNPSMTGLKSLWDAKELAVVLGVGYPSPNRSHFRSMDIWQSAVPESDEITGWLGRWLDQGGDDPMKALALGPTLPKLMGGAKTAGGSIPSGNLALPGGNRLDGAFSSVETAFAGQSALAGRVAESGTDLLTLIKTVGDVLANQPETAVGGANLEPAANAPTNAPTTAAAGAKPVSPARASQLASQLDLVARLIKGGAPTRAYSISLGGFDTHAAEKDAHSRLVGVLDAGIAGFLKAFDGDPKGDHVVVVAYSEFGRRVSANASGGTDHGTAAPVLVAGKAIKGGFFGEQPSLTDLDQGDLKFNTDFRSVYATIMDKVLGIDPKSILQGHTFPSLGFV